MQNKLKKKNTIFENLWISKSNHRILGDLIWKNTKFKFQNKLKEYYFEKLPNIKSNHRILNPRLRRTADTALYQKVFVYDCHCQLSAQLPLIRIIIIKYQISSPCWSAESLGYLILQRAKLPHPPRILWSLKDGEPSHRSWDNISLILFWFSDIFLLQKLEVAETHEKTSDFVEELIWNLETCIAASTSDNEIV